MTEGGFPGWVESVRRRLPMILLPVMVTTGVALALSLSGTKKYDATARLLVRDQAAIDSLLAPGETSAEPKRDLNTAAELIKAGGTAHGVQRLLRLNEDVDDLLDQVSVDTRADSDIVSIRVRDEDPVRAAVLANAFALSYVTFRETSARQRYRRAARLAAAQLRALGSTARTSAQGRELESRQRELEIAATLQTGGAQIVRRASVPDSPSRPRPLLSTALGVMLGLLLGLAAALAAERLDRRLRDESAVEALFGLPILAAIPRRARRGGEPEDRGQREAYGLLAANLRYATLDRSHSGVMMVTSASPAEGKTSVTLGAARALARLGLRVIAVEADLRRPAFGDWVAEHSSLGIMGIIGNRATFHEALVWVDVDTLEVLSGERTNGSAASLALLPAGGLPANPQRVLTSARFESLVALARGTADVVIVDTAPLGTVNDAGPVLGLVDTVVVVARIHHTTRDAVRRARRVLQSADAKLAGVVVTDAGAPEDYGHYYGDARQSRTAAATRSRS